MAKTRSDLRQCVLKGLLLIGAALCQVSDSHAQQPRSWTDVTGKRSLKAVFVTATEDAVKLGKSDGGMVTVPLSRLSTADRQYLTELQSQLDSAKLAYDQAVVLYETARGKAVSLLKQATSTAGCGRSYNRLGLDAVENGKYDDAKRYFTAAVRSLSEIQRFDASIRYSYVAALNNSALASLRERSVKGAVSALARCEGVLEDNPPELTHNVNVIDVVYADRRSLSKSIERAVSKVSASSEIRDFDPSLGWIYMFEQPYETAQADNEPETVQSFIAQKSGQLLAYASGSGFVVAPGIVLTNRHVVELDDGMDVDRIQIHTVDNIDKAIDSPYEARVIAKDENSDLALLEVTNLQAPNMQLSANLARLAEKILILGFPQTTDFGDSLTTTTGSIAKLPEAANDMMYALDAKANPGNSGGPVVSDTGDVIGILQGKKIGSGQILMNDAYTLAVPSTDAMSFCTKHVSNLPPSTAQSERADFADVTERVKHSLVFIHVFLDQVTVNHLQRQEMRQQTTAAATAPTSVHWNGVSDKRCMMCDGRGFVSCTNRNCAGGSVKQKVTEYVPAPNGGQVMSQRVVKERCPVCNGQNRIECANCNGEGIDLHFAASQRYARRSR